MHRERHEVRLDAAGRRRLQGGDRVEAPASLRRCPGRGQQHGGLGQRLQAALGRRFLERGDVAGEDLASSRARGFKWRPAAFVGSIAHRQAA